MSVARGRDSKPSVRNRIHSMFVRYIPTKVSKVERALQLYAGRETEFLEALIDKYGPEPQLILPMAAQQPNRFDVLLEHPPAADPSDDPLGDPSSDAMAMHPAFVNSFLLRRQHCEYAESRSRNGIADHERRASIAISVAAVDSRAAAIKAEAARLHHTLLVDARSMVAAEIATMRQEREEAMARKRHDEQQRSLTQTERDERVSNHRAERSERKLMLYNFSISTSLLLKRAVHTEREMKYLRKTSGALVRDICESALKNQVRPQPDPRRKQNPRVAPSRISPGKIRRLSKALLDDPSNGLVRRQSVVAVYSSQHPRHAFSLPPIRSTTTK